MRQRGPVAFASRLSPVSRSAPRTSARATYAASYTVRLSRNCQQRSSSAWCGARTSGIATRSASARPARRRSTAPVLTCRRRTDPTSRSRSSGAASSSPRSRARAWSPSGPSSARATTNTLASTTSTIRPHRRDRRLQSHRSTRTPAGTVEDLLQGRPARFLDKPRTQILLQRLMRGRGALPQYGVRLLGNILDLHTRHSAILAPQAPDSNRVTFGMTVIYGGQNALPERFRGQALRMERRSECPTSARGRKR
jgi:hypothetical protein